MPALVLGLFCDATASQGSAVSGTAVDLLVNYTSGSGSVTTANVAAATLGGLTGSWSYLNSISTLVATTIASTTVTRKWALQCLGISYQVFNRVIHFDLSGSDLAWEGVNRTLPAGHANVTMSALVKVGATGSYAMDVGTLDTNGGGGFAICQANPGVFNSHSTNGVTTRGRSASDPGTWVIINWKQNTATGFCEVVVIDNTSGAVLLSSRCASTGTTPSDFNISNYLHFNGGVLDIAAVAVDLSGKFPFDPVTAPAPTSVVATQTNNNELTFTFSSVCQIFVVERTSDGGANWTTLNSNYDVVTDTDSGAYTLSYVDSTVSNTVTYQYRLTAKLSGLLSPTALSNAITVANVAVPTPNLLWWKCNEGSGVSLASAISGTTGTTGSGWSSSTASGSGSCLDVTTTGAFSNAPIAYGSNQVTVFFRAYSDNWTQTGMLIESSTDSAANGSCWRIIDSTGDLIFLLSGTAFSSTGLKVSVPSPSNSVWHSIALVMDNSSNPGAFTIYFDGVLQAPTPEQNDKNTSGNIATQVLYWGARGSTTLPFTGRIDDIRVFNSALNATQIGALDSDLANS